MRAERSRVALITSHFPFDGKEPFLYPEIMQLARAYDIMLVPAASFMRRSSFPQLDSYVARQYTPLSVRTAGAAIREFARDPVTALDTLRAVVRGPASLRAKVRNLLIFPKALAVARLLRRTGVQHVHAYWLSTPTTIAYVASRLNDIGWSATGHRWDLADSNITTIGKPNAGFVDSARFVRTISRAGADLLAFALRTDKTPRITVIHLGVDLPTMQARRVCSKPHHLRLACIAAFLPRKGHNDLIAALAKVKAAGIAFNCTMFGAGPLRGAICRAATNAGLTENVTVTSLAHAELLRTLSDGRFDSAILTSVDEGAFQGEGIPVSLMEAMATGMPCIATRVGGVSELVNEANGMLVEPKDIEGIANAIITLATDNTLRQRLGHQARADVEAGFSVERTAPRLAALIALHIRQRAPSFPEMPERPKTTESKL